MLIHGIGASADIWSVVMNSLVSKGYEVIAPDMLGHGFSSAPTKSGYYTFSSLVLQALTIFDHYMVNSKRKCVLIGHSYGYVKRVSSKFLKKNSGIQLLEKQFL